MQTQRLTLPALMLLSSPLLSLPPTLVQAQIVFENGNVPAPQEAGTYEIKPEAGTVHGPHLEYRFSQFDLPQATDSASFTGPAPGVQNVIGLINGASYSIINGTLSCNIPDANLYLLNPNGILIGPTATVNVPGSFYAAAANSVTVDGQTFMVTGNAPIFSSIRANLADFGFVRNPGRLTVRGNINVTGSSSSANLVGDEILVQDANISPPNSFEAKGTIINVQDSIINTTNPGSTVKMEGEQVTVANSQISTVGNFEAKGTTSITVQNKSEIKTTDPGSIVKMEGDRITIEDSKVFGNSTPEDKNGIEVTGKSSVSVKNSSLEGAGGAGGVENRIVNAQIKVDSTDSPDVNGQVTVQGGNLVVDQSDIRVISQQPGQINVEATDVDVLLNDSRILLKDSGTEQEHGAVRLTTGNTGGAVTLSNQSRIITSVLGTTDDSGGKSGRVAITANRVNLTGRSGIDTSTHSTSNAGNIKISATGADGLVWLSNSFINALTDSYNVTKEQGKAGDINIQAKQIKLTENSAIGAPTYEDGEGGTIRINTDTLDVTNSSIAVGTLGKGMGGSLQIIAKRYITLSGETSILDGKIGLPMFAITADSRYGGGDVNNGSIDQVEEESPTAAVHINTPSLTINQGAVISAATFGSGQGGDLRIEADNIKVENSNILATSIGSSTTGKGGSIDILTDQLELIGTSGIDFGTIDVSTRVDRLLTGEIGIRNAGNLTIDTLSGRLPNISLRDGASIKSVTENTGQGGLIEINATDLTLDTDPTMEGKSGIFATTEYVGQNGGEAGRIVIRNASKVSLNNSIIDNSTKGTGNASSVKIFAKNDEGIVTLSRDSYIRSAVVKPVTGNGGKISLVANKVELKENSGILADTFPESSGEGGAITINTGDLTVNKSSIAVSTTGSGQTGNIQINATNQIDLIGQGTVPDLATHEVPLFAISVDSRGSGDVKRDNDTFITTPKLTLTDGAVISAATFGSGQGGNFKINANRLTVKESNIAAATLGSGQGGSIEISSSDINLVGVGNNLNLPNFSNIDVSSRKYNPINSDSDRGNAGSLTIMGSLPGTPPNITLTDGASISSATETKGNGGNLDIQANNILMETGTNISAKAEAEGNAGHIKINASGPLAAQDSQITTESAKSKGGDIEVNTPALAVTGASGSINASVSGQQAGGNINVNVDSLNVTDGGSIKSSTDGQGQGGNVTVNANTVVSIIGQSSTLASATSNQGPAGSIQITSPQLALAQGGKIDTSSTAQGNSGRITVQTTGLSLSDQAEITAKATAEGHSGDIQVTTGTLNMNNAAKISADSSQGTGNAGSIKINTTAQKADSISLTNDSEITTTANTGAGGTIELHSRDFTLENSKINAKVISGTSSAAPATVTLDTQHLVSRNGTIESSSGGQGRAGNIAITATEYIELTGTSIISKTTGSGAAGQITLGTNNAPLPSLTLTGTHISTTSESSGDSGEISLVVNGELNLAGSTLESKSTGGGNPNAKAANITVKSNALTLDGASVISSSTNGASRAGMITLDATSVTNSGEITSEASGSGDAGAIKIGNEQQRVSELTVNPGENSKISTTASGTSASGTIDIYADKVTVNGGKIQSQATGIGKDGNLKANITLHEVKELKIENTKGEISSSTAGNTEAGDVTVSTTSSSSTVDISQGKISSNAEAKGNAGKIQVGQEGQSFGNVTLNNGKIETTAKVSNSGEIGVYAKDLVITGTSSINAENKEGRAKSQTPANIKVNATASLTVKDGGQIKSSTSGQNPAGTITITAPTIDIGTTATNGTTCTTTPCGRIESSTTGSGAAGTISISASEYIGISGEKSGIFSTSRAGGKAGGIVIAERVVDGKGEGLIKKGLTLSDGSQINTDASGNSLGGGSITVHATNLTITGKDSLPKDNNSAITSISSSDKKGETANIVVNTKQTTLSQGGQIKSSTTGASEAGHITIAAVDKVDISGRGSSISSTATGKKDDSGKPPGNPPGNAGTVIIVGKLNNGKADTNTSVQELNLNSGGQINTEANESNSGKIDIHANTIAVGKDSLISAVNKIGHGGATPEDAANIDVQGNTLTLSDGGNITSSTSGQNPAGTITITMSETAEVQNKKGHIDIYGQGSGIFSKAENKPEVNPEGVKGPAGKIHLTSSQIDLGKFGCGLANCQGGRIETSTDGIGAAGTISISASDYINIAGEGSGIFSKANPGAAGNAGEIVIAAQVIKDAQGQVAKDDKGNPQVQGLVGQGLTVSEGSKKGLTVSGGSKISTEANVSNSGQIHIHADTIAVRDKDSSISAVNKIGHGGATPEDAANIDVQGNTLTLSDGGNITSSTSGQNPAGTISISASDYINISGEKSGIFSKANPGAAGNAGKITIANGNGSVDSLTVSKGGQISTAADVSNSGTINIHANTVKVSGASAISAENTNGRGTEQVAADIDIQANTALTLNEGGNIKSSTSGKNPAGKITITAPKVNIGTTDIATDCTGNNCGRIESSTSGLGEAGNITITASEYLHLAGGVDSGIFSKSELPQDTSNKTGVRNSPSAEEPKQPQERKAGSITIYAGGTSTSPPTEKGEFAKAEDSPIPEKVSYFKKSSDSEKWTPDKGLELSGSSQINTSTATSGNGGTIKITASQLALGESSEISAKEEGTANQAGSIYVGTDTFSMAKDSKISTNATDAKEGGGNILIGVNHIPPAAGSKIPRISGKITASVTGGAGKGGNVEITSDNKEVFHKEFQPKLNEDGSVTQNGLLFVLDGGKITANADEGDGGKIKNGVPKYFIQSGDSEVDASSRTGINGIVKTEATQIDMGAISRLPGEPVDVSKLIKDCARKTQGQWSLRQGGRGSSKQDKEKDKEEGCKR